MNASAAAAVLAGIVGRLERGDAAGAEERARAACAEFPANPEIARLHGVALLMLGRVAAARVVLERALRLHPADVAIRSNLASARLAAGDADGAVALLRELVQARPGDAALHNNLANALRAAGDDAAARDEYLAALRAAPGHPGATLNLAAAELALGRAPEAEARVRGVLAVRRDPRALLLLGQILQREQRHAEAEAVYAEGARAAPGAAEFPYQAGLAADEQQHYGAAAGWYRRALALDPGLQLAEGQLLFVLRRACDWAAAAPIAARVRARALDGSGSVDPFIFLAEDATAAEQLTCATARAARVMREIEPVRRRLQLPRGTHPTSGPLRVGFVAAGFHAHATALLTVALFEDLGRRPDLEVHLYATTPDDGSEVRRRLRKAVHALREAAGQPAAALARDVASRGIDVLVDVDGWCAGGMPELFALRPAPVQVAWLAYPGTTGAPYIDFLVADTFLVPEASRRFYSETIAYLPRCYQPSDPTRIVGPAPPRAECGLPDDAVVFASFNNAWKLNEASFARMCAVLRGVPGSVLWLLHVDPEGDARLRGAARALDVDPSRLVFAPALPHLQHLARLQLADLFLDTNPYNAHTTASDAIWAGCPVLTRPGATFASRVAGSLNRQLGLPELNTPDDAAFIATAVRYGSDRAALADLRARLAALRRTSGLFDMHAYAEDFAALLQELAPRGRRMPAAGTAPDAGNPDKLAE